MVFILEEWAPHYFKDPRTAAVIIIIIIIIMHLGRLKGISEQYEFSSNLTSHSSTLKASNNILNFKSVQL